VPPELVIFDCDGVLVDSEPIAVRVDQEILASVGLDLSREEIIDRFVGRSAAVMEAAVAEHLGHPVTPAMRAHFDRLYADAMASELTPVPGVVRALERIPQPKCVASSSKMSNLRRKLAMTGLLPFFGNAIFSADQVARGKPAPDLFLFAAERMSAAPGACVVVEDSQYGVSAALAAGMRVLAFAGGITAASSLRQDGAVLFDDMSALPGLLGT
jgi:HAD superfamily hydrolase (TIGR01509 family)